MTLLFLTRSYSFYLSMHELNASIDLSLLFVPLCFRFSIQYHYSRCYCHGCVLCCVPGNYNLHEDETCFKTETRPGQRNIPIEFM